MTQDPVKWFNGAKGFGFIAQDDGGPDVFVHYSAMGAQGYRAFNQDDRVEFEVGRISNRRQEGRGISDD
ncbi:cold-shock protein [Nocardia sp. NPDC051052]|uniref:cold-shock protein n=1 Tax=Nocardia sp. NPDC051052 TaxID=3364322 RepID=UPI0037B65A1A